MEKNTGSLRNLADQLGGRVISGPASHGTSSIPAAPPRAHLKGQTTSEGTINSTDSASRTPNPPASSSQVAAGSTVSGNAAGLRTNEWLELCIRSGPDTHTLREIDVAGNQTDTAVFQKIAEAYRFSRRTRFWRHFDARVPNGGVFVQVGPAVFRLPLSFPFKQDLPHSALQRKQCLEQPEVSRGIFS